MSIFEEYGTFNLSAASAKVLFQPKSINIKSAMLMHF